MSNGIISNVTNKPNLTTVFTASLNSKKPNQEEPTPNPILTASICLIVLTLIPVDQNIRNASGILGCFLLWITLKRKPQLIEKILQLIFSKNSK